MNREEAIKILVRAITEVEWEYPLDISVAIEMAIKDMRVVDKLIRENGEK